MKTEHRKHALEFKQLYEKARIAKKAGFAITCDADEVVSLIEALAEIRHEKANGWAAYALRKRYEISVAPIVSKDAHPIKLTVYQE